METKTFVFGGLLETSNSMFSFGVITVCAICVFILLANVLRRKVPLFRRSLMPTAVIAGLLGLIVKEVVLAITKANGMNVVDGIPQGINIFNTVTLQAVVYHMLPVGFIALCLREKGNYESEFNAGQVKMERVAAAKSGCLIISYYMLQALIGIGVTVLLGITFMPQLNKATGIMLALGYGQGPQQAYATGLIWDAARHMSFWGEGSAMNFGLTIAALGFLWASIPGIILVNIVAKRKGLTVSRNEFQKSGELSNYNVPIEGPDEVPLSESIDKFSLQVCMVAGVYLITIAVIIGIEAIFRASGVNFLIGLIPTFWGFAFMLAALIAIITKMILRRLVKTGVMRRKYPNNYMMNRISGAAFDISITAALFTISVTKLGTLWIPILIMTTICGIILIFYVKAMCYHIYKDYKDEAWLAFYGMSTGTIPNGMILCREIDKDFKTPASEDLVIGSSAAIILGFPLLLLIAQAPRPGNLWWVTLIILGYFLVLLAYLLKDKLFKKKAVTS
jgi:ESS family glutamate:Na+ symporter